MSLKDKKLFPGSCNAECGMLNALYGFKQVRQRPDFGAGAFYGYYFQAVVVVQVHVLGGDDGRAVIVLYVQEFIYHFALVVVID